MAFRARAILGLAALLAAPVHAEPAHFVLDAEHLSIGFLVEHLGYAKTLGFFQRAEGSFDFDETTAELGEVHIAVETESVFTNNERRDRHLRSGDFLDVRQFPEMTFHSARVRRTGEQTFDLEGELTLLGVTRPLSLHATLNKIGAYPMDGNPYVIGVSASGTLLRSEFGMTYGVDAGWVGDIVEIIIEFEARRQ
jgi:polyisoprenoid-binding protein YceI